MPTGLRLPLFVVFLCLTTFMVCSFCIPPAEAQNQRPRSSVHLMDMSLQPLG